MKIKLYRIFQFQLFNKVFEIMIPMVFRTRHILDILKIFLINTENSWVLKKGKRYKVKLKL